jgi:SAM-dependent methyltransferase
VETELQRWHEWYLPVGHTVLDLGAGCGETAFFYLNHGAKRVIAVEYDPEALRLLRENFASDDRVTIIDARIDSIKSDIEGSERNMVVETHFPFKLRKVKTLTPNVTIWKLSEDWGNILTKAIRLLKKARRT